MRYAIATVLVIFAVSAMAQPVLHYQVPMGESTWKVKGNKLFCRMQQTIPSYGVVAFHNNHAEPNQFRLRAWQPQYNPQNALLLAKKPIWKTHTGTIKLAEIPLHAGQNLVKLDDLETQNLLRYLQEGYVTRFEYDSDNGNKIRVDVPLENFNKAYAKYMRCVGNLLPFAFDTIREISVHFRMNKSYVDTQWRKRLRQLARYVIADKSVKKVRIDGYADNTGRPGHNYYLSELRAKAVEQYLIEQGVPKDKIYVTWHGIKDPVTQNETANGRFKNRRVKVRVLH